MKKYEFEIKKIILAIYYFKKNLNNKKIKEIANILSIRFNREFSTNDVIYCLTRIKSVDPSFKQSTLIDKASDEWKLWKYYIVNDRTKELKQLLDALNTNTSKLQSLTQNEYISYNFKKMKYTYKEDLKKELYIEKNISSADSRQMRDPQVVFNALKLANYKCEYNSLHETFVRKNTFNIPYTEGHHLIPLKFQKKFNYNLDVEANVVSLCSHCHNLLHYGKDIEKILTVLFKLRIKRLEKCGIKITLKELKKMYL